MLYLMEHLVSKGFWRLTDIKLMSHRAKLPKDHVTRKDGPERRGSKPG